MALVIFSGLCGLALIFFACYSMRNNKRLSILQRNLDDLERNLSQKEKTLERLQGAARIGCWELSLGSKKFTPAVTFLKMLGLSPESRICETVDDLEEFVYPADRDATFKWLNELDMGASTRTFHRWIRLDAEVRYFWSIAWPEFDESGRVLKFCGLSQDITDEKALEKLLPHVTKLASIGEMAAVVSHELKSPLALLYNYIELAEMGEEQGLVTQNTSAILEKMRATCEKMNRVVSGLKAYSRPMREIGLLVDVNQAVTETAQIFKELFPKLRFDLQLELLEDSPAFIGSAEKLQSILMNLLVNSKDAVLPVKDPSMKVVTQVRGERVEIQVIDNGLGMTPDVKSRLFEPFFTTKCHGAGLGLGLSICRSLAAEMQGELAVDSAPGKGASFVLSFPWVDPFTPCLASSDGRVFDAPRAT